jgi:hypothetical protein
VSEKGQNATLVSITRPAFDLDDGKWLPLPNSLLRGDWPVRLTALEHAILCALLSLPPDGWDNVREWVDKLPFEDSAGARAKALAGLEKKGYLTRKRYSMGRGKFRYEWSVTAEPEVSAGHITRSFSRHESSGDVNEPILEDGPLKDGPFKDGPVTGTSTHAQARDESGTGRDSSKPGQAHPLGGQPGLKSQREAPASPAGEATAKASPQWTTLVCGSTAACPCEGNPAKLGYCLHVTEVPAEPDGRGGLRPIQTTDNVVPFRRQAQAG